MPRETAALAAVFFVVAARRRVRPCGGIGGLPAEVRRPLAKVVKWSGQRLGGEKAKRVHLWPVPPPRLAPPRRLVPRQPSRHRRRLSDQASDYRRLVVIARIPSARRCWRSLIRSGVGILYTPIRACRGGSVRTCIEMHFVTPVCGHLSCLMSLGTCFSCGFPRHPGWTGQRRRHRVLVGSSEVERSDLRSGNVLAALVVEPVGHRASAVTLQPARGVEWSLAAD